MRKILITGNPGSGKSTLMRLMRDKGFEAYDLEGVKGAVRLEHKNTGKKADWPQGHIDWKIYAWNIQGSKLNELLENDRDVYIGISASNIDDFYTLFDMIIVLSVDDNELRKRLYERNAHKNNHSVESLEYWISKNREWNDYAISQGAIVVESGKSVKDTMAMVLDACGISKNS